MEPLSTLSTEARARLAAFRRAESPDRGVAERCLEVLEQRLETGDRLPVADAPPRRRLAAPLLGALALAACALLAFRWAATGGLLAPQTGSAAAYHNHDEPARHLAEPRAPRSSAGAPLKVRSVPVPEEPAPSDISPPELPVESPVPGDTPATLPESPVPGDTSAAIAPPVSPDTSKSSRRPARDDGVAAEVDLLRRAKLAQPAARLVLLEEHARRFPTGILAAERELLVIETRCALDEVERARHLAERFIRRFPGSPLVERVAAICGGPDPGR